MTKKASWGVRAGLSLPLFSRKKKCFISFLHLTITGAAKHTTVNDIFSRSSRSESKLGLLVKYTYTVLDSAMPFLVLKAKFRGEKSGERNLRTKAISVLVLILNSLAIVLRCKTKQEKPPRFL